YGRAVERLSPEALRSLADYAWPGNVRELRNVLERLYVEATAEVIPRSALLEWEAEREDLAAGSWNVDLREAQRIGAVRALIPPPSLHRAPSHRAPRVVDMHSAPGGWAMPAGPGALPHAPDVIDIAATSRPAARTSNPSRRPRTLSDDAVR